MAKRAEFAFDVNSEGLDRLDQKLADTEKRARSLFSQLPKDLQKDLGKAAEAVAASARTAIIGTVTSAASAIARPAMSTFAESIAGAKAYREEMTRTAIGTGQSFAQAGAQISDARKRIGEMPEVVKQWGRSVQASTGDWGGAMKSIDAFQDRALKLNKNLLEMSGSAGQLENLFGMKDSGQITTFFNTMDLQSAKLGANLQKADAYFASMAGHMGAFMSGGPEKMSAISTAFLAQAGGNTEQASRVQSGTEGWVSSHKRQIANHMRAKGALGKNESLLDPETGKLSPEMFLRVVEFEQQNFKSNPYLKGKKFDEQAGIMEGSGMSAETYANMRRFDTGSARAAMGLKGGKDATALGAWSGSAAQQRIGADADKIGRDIRLGMTMLPAQDAAVQAGGGAAGIAMERASGVFSTAANTFSDAVLKTVPGLGFRAAGGAAGAGAAGVAAGAGAKAAAGGVARVAAGGIAKGALRAAGPLGIAATLLDGTEIARDKAPEAGHNPLAYGAAYQAFDEGSTKVGPFRFGGPQPGAVPAEVVSKLTPSDIRALAQEFGSALVSKVLKVQQMPTAAAPQGASNAH